MACNTLNPSKRGRRSAKEITQWRYGSVHNDESGIASSINREFDNVEVTPYNTDSEGDKQDRDMFGCENISHGKMQILYGQR